MTNYEILTNTDFEVKDMLDKAQKRKRSRLADVKDIKDAANDLWDELKGFMNPEAYKGLEVTCYVGEAIPQHIYRKHVSEEHTAFVEQPTTAFTLRFNGDGSFTLTEVKRKNHPGYCYAIAACPEDVMMIILQKFLEAGLDNWGMKMRAMAEQKEMTEIYEEECKAEAIAFSNEMQRMQEEEAIKDELEFWGHGTEKSSSGRYSQIIEDGFTYQARIMNDWDY